MGNVHQDPEMALKISVLFLHLFAFQHKKRNIFQVWPPLATLHFGPCIQGGQNFQSLILSSVAAEKKKIRTGKSKQYFYKWHLSFFFSFLCMSILHFSTCLQREADKKDLLGLFVAEGWRVPFLCSAARQILQVKLPQQGQSCPEGTTPGTEAGFLFFFLCSPL